MRLFSKPFVWREVIAVFVLAACLLASFFALQSFGIEERSAKGLSVVITLALVVVGLFFERLWLSRRWDRRFEGLSLEQTLGELDKVFEEQIASGLVTRAELDAAKEAAKNRFDRGQTF